MGNDLVSPGDIVSTSISDTFVVKLYNHSAIPMVSQENSILMIGNYTDAFFGITKASFLQQFDNSYIVDYSLSRQPKADSAYMYFIHYKYFNNNQPLLVNVYECNSYINDSSTYWSDYESKNSYKGYPDNPLFSFTINASDSIIKIPLPNSLSNKLIGNTDSTIYSDAYRFCRYFRGLYFEPAQSSVSDNNLHELAFVSDTSIAVYYHTLDSTYVAYFTAQPSYGGTWVNYYKHTNPASGVGISKYIDDVADTVLYMQGLAGPVIKFSTPSLEGLKAEGKIAINKAVLTLPMDTADASVNKYIAYPATLGLMRYYYKEDSLTTTSDYNYNTQAGLKFEYDNLHNNYQLDITLQLQQYLSGKLEKPDFFIYPVTSPAYLTQGKFYNTQSRKAKLQIIYSKLK
jgi:hypothetical protein